MRLLVIERVVLVAIAGLRSKERAPFHEANNSNSLRCNGGENIHKYTMTIAYVVNALHVNQHRHHVHAPGWSVAVSTKSLQVPRPVVVGRRWTDRNSQAERATVITILNSGLTV